MTGSEKAYDWEVTITGKARRQIEKLPPDMAERLDSLLQDLRANGPEARSWPHSGPLKGKKEPGWHHCHLNKGQPRYVAIWQVIDKVAKLMEVRYAGTHENAKYRQIN